MQYRGGRLCSLLPISREINLYSTGKATPGARPGGEGEGSCHSGGLGGVAYGNTKEGGRLVQVGVI